MTIRRSCASWPCTCLCRHCFFTAPCLDCRRGVGAAGQPAGLPPGNRARLLLASHAAVPRHRLLRRHHRPVRNPNQVSSLRLCPYLWHPTQPPLVTASFDGTIARCGIHHNSIGIQFDETVPTETLLRPTETLLRLSLHPTQPSFVTASFDGTIARCVFPAHALYFGTTTAMPYSWRPSQRWSLRPWQITASVAASSGADQVMNWRYRCMPSGRLHHAVQRIPTGRGGYRPYPL